MSTVFHFWGILIITVSSFVGLVIIITSYDPYTAGMLVKSLFFGSVILVLIGLVMAGRVFVKKMVKKIEPRRGKTQS